MAIWVLLKGTIVHRVVVPSIDPLFRTMMEAEGYTIREEEDGTPVSAGYEYDEENGAYCNSMRGKPMNKWLLIKDGVVQQAVAARDDKWLRHYKASKFTVVEVDPTERVAVGWLYQDGKFSKPIPIAPVPPKVLALPDPLPPVPEVATPPVPEMLLEPVSQK